VVKSSVHAVIAVIVPLRFHRTAGILSQLPL